MIIWIVRVIWFGAVVTFLWAGWDNPCGLAGVLGVDDCEAAIVQEHCDTLTATCYPG